MLSSRAASWTVRRHLGLPTTSPLFCHSKVFDQPSILRCELATSVVPIVTARRHVVTEPDRRTTALTVISNLKHIRHSPVPALTLGLGGLIPFVSAPVYMILTQNFCADIAFAQLAYGASVLSFLGGIRWGAALPSGSNIAPDWKNLAYSIKPSLVAWLGLLLPFPMSTLTVVAGLCGSAYFDLTMAGYPAWFKALRFLLTFVAVLSLWTTITIKYLLMLSERNVSTVSLARPRDSQPMNDGNDMRGEK